MIFFFKQICLRCMSTTGDDAASTTYNNGDGSANTINAHYGRYFHHNREISNKLEDIYILI